METMWRLAWALPLVLLSGVLITLLLKRFVVAREGGQATAERRMHLRESLALSDDTRMHLIELDREAYLVVESKQHIAVEIAVRGVPASPWLQRMRSR